MLKKSGRVSFSTAVMQEKSLQHYMETMSRMFQGHQLVNNKIMFN